MHAEERGARHVRRDYADILAALLRRADAHSEADQGLCYSRILLIFWGGVGLLWFFTFLQRLINAITVGFYRFVGLGYGGFVHLKFLL